MDDTKGLVILFCSHHGKSLTKDVVHVPVHPVLGDLGFEYPDTCAAATLTPNVIRAGRRGVWTNSGHVISAIGGYSGLSSSYISTDYNVHVLVGTCRKSEHQQPARCESDLPVKYASIPNQFQDLVNCCDVTEHQ